jgi:hypothetical protein
LVYHNGYLWRSNVDNNTDEPSLDDQCANNKWLAVVDTQEYLEFGGRTVQVSTSQELIEALSCIDYHQFIAPYIIELRAGTYTLSSTSIITRAGATGNWIHLKGQSGVVIENGTANDYMFFLRDGTVMTATDIEFKGNGNNNGIDVGFGSIYYAPTGANTYRDFRVALRAISNSYIEVSNSVFINNKTGVYATRNSVINATGINYETVVDNGNASYGARAEYNSSVNIGSATIKSPHFGGHASYSSSIRATSATIENTFEAGIFTSYGSSADATDINIDGKGRSVHGLRAINQANINAGSAGTSIVRVTKAVLAEEGSVINAENATLKSSLVGLGAIGVSIVHASGCDLECFGGFKVYLTNGSTISAKSSTFNNGGDLGYCAGNCYLVLDNTTGDGKVTLENWGYANLINTAFTSNLPDNTVTVDGVSRK